MRSAALLLLLGAAWADVYMHAPRGSNDRNCAGPAAGPAGAGGRYACPRPRVGPRAPAVDKATKMYYHPGSEMVVEWTNQHGCGTNPRTGCEIVIQYACEDTLDPTKKWRSNDDVHVGSPRDGTPRDANDAATDRIPNDANAAKADNVESRRFGMHESTDFYQKCRNRQRNKGLYTSDQNVGSRGTNTRQNPNGNRRGLECPEERDYYPHWQASPWIDVAVITNNPERCPYYKAESSNVKPRGECVSKQKFWGERSIVKKATCPGTYGRLPLSSQGGGGGGGGNGRTDTNSNCGQWASQFGCNAGFASRDGGGTVADRCPVTCAGRTLLSQVQIEEHATDGPYPEFVQEGVGAADDDGRWPSMAPQCEAAGHVWTPVWWDSEHPKTSKFQTAWKTRTQATVGGFRNEIVGMTPMSKTANRGGVVLSAGVTEGAVSSCGRAFETGDACGCPPGFKFKTAAGQCVQDAAGTSDCVGSMQSWQSVRKTYGLATAKVTMGGDYVIGNGNDVVPSSSRSVQQSALDPNAKCPRGYTVIEDEVECRAAGAWLGYSSSDRTTWPDMPPGCVLRKWGVENWDRNGPKGGPDVAVFQADPSEKTVWPFRYICKRATTRMVEEPLQLLSHSPPAGEQPIKMDDMPAVDASAISSSRHLLQRQDRYAECRDWATNPRYGCDAKFRDGSTVAKHCPASCNAAPPSPPAANERRECGGWVRDYGCNAGFSDGTKVHQYCAVSCANNGGGGSGGGGGPPPPAPTARPTQPPPTPPPSPVPTYDPNSKRRPNPPAGWGPAGCFDCSAQRPGRSGCSPDECNVEGSNSRRSVRDPATGQYKGYNECCKVSCGTCPAPTPAPPLYQSCNDYCKKQSDGLTTLKCTAAWEEAPGGKSTIEQPQVPCDHKFAAGGAACKCQVEGGATNKNFRRVSGFLRPKKGGAWTFMVSNEAGAKLYLDGKVIATGTGRGEQKWVSAKPQNLAANRQVSLVATSRSGEELASVAIAVKMPDGTLEAPMSTRGASDASYQLCSTKSCDEDVQNINPQTQATANCKCKKWSDAVNVDASSPLGAAGAACAQPDFTRFTAPWCFCEQPQQAVGTAGKAWTGGTELTKLLPNAGWTNKIQLKTPPGPSWCANACSETSKCAGWEYSVSGQAQCTLYSKVGTLGDSTQPSIQSGRSTDKGVPVWSYCDASLAPKRGSLLETEDEDSWVESEVETEAAVAGQTPKEMPTVDCVSGESAMSRENQLGNSRGTSTNRKEMEAAIPHGVNANRYIWKMPEHINENCVLRLRYNISTADYFAWNNEGQPMTDARHNQNRNSGSSNSPVVQDPYLGIGTDPTKSFLSLAVNTNQYGRTFQDRSYVFAIRPRPQGMPATAKIYNVNVRGKRGNIVQTYPAVEYDFVPNDLCIDKDDFVHFQWTGSDYNPQRNPNDAEGGGDSLDQNQARRADRSNIVDMDSLPKKQWRRSPSGTGLSGAGQRHAAVDSGHAYPAGSLQDWQNLDTKYTGMFWGEDGKPDQKMIMKMGFLDQIENLKLQGQQCLSPEQLSQLNQNARERDPRNCAKLNAAGMDKQTGQRGPYFDGGIVKMRKAGRFGYMGTRNYNFSNRNQAGSICVKQGTQGTCAANAGCEETKERELLGKFKEEDPTGKRKATKLADKNNAHKRLASESKQTLSLMAQLEAAKAENARLKKQL